MRNNGENVARLPKPCGNIMDSVADGVFTVDEKMRITMFNRAAEEMTGLSREDVLGKRCHEVFQTEICRTDCPVREAFETGKPVLNREVYIQNKSGCKTPMSVNASILYDFEGRAIGGVETIHDLSNIEMVLDCVAEGVLTVDESMIIKSFNRAAEEITGFSHNEAVGRHCHAVFRSEVCSKACPVREAMDTGESVMNRELEILDRNNCRKLISVSASPLFGADGKILGGVETVRDISMIRKLRNELREKYNFQEIISRNPAMQRLFEVMSDIASSEATVFLQGESGTGKELFARAIHNLSPRSKGPLVIVNCGALPETLLEAEIFGVRKGAYTGAVENRPGRLEMCNGGTFFLDEIGDLPLQLQVKLLRVLENREFQPLGGKHPIKADVRFIAATHRNLEEMVEAGTFRRDLFFRINILSLYIPPLRERREDIPLLIEVALHRFNETYGKNICGVSPEVLKFLFNHDFAGNIRELMNLIEQAVILCKGGEIGLEHMPKGLLASTGCGHLHARRTSKAPPAAVLADIIARHRGDKFGAAEELGINRSTLWRWLKSAGISNYL